MQKFENNEENNTKIQKVVFLKKNEKSMFFYYIKRFYFLRPLLRQTLPRQSINVLTKSSKKTNIGGNTSKSQMRRKTS